MKNISAHLAGASLALLIGGGWLVAATENPDESTVLRLVYSGNRRSELEPCGCKANQQGGADLEATWIKSQLAEKMPMLRVDAGNFTDRNMSENEFLKTEYLLKSMKANGYEILNVGRGDAMLGLEFLKGIEKDPGFQLVSANVIDPVTHKPIFAPFVIRQYPGPKGEGSFKVAITGFTAPDLPAVDVKIDLEEARKLAQAPVPMTAAPAAAQPGALDAKAAQEDLPAARVAPLATERQMGFWFAPPGHEQLYSRILPEQKSIMPLVEASKLGIGDAQLTDPNFNPNEARLQALARKLAGDTAADKPAVEGDKDKPAETKPAADTKIQPAAKPEGDKSSDAGGAKKPGMESANSAEAARTAELMMPPAVPAPKPNEALFGDPQGALAQLIPALRKEADFVVVLADFPQPNAKQIATAVPGIDLMVTSHEVRAPQAPERAGDTVIVDSGFDGRTVGNTRIFYEASKKRFNAEGEVVTVDAKFSHDAEVKKILDTYKTQTERLFPPPPQFPRYTLSGAETCKTCHVSEYQQWSETRHSHAMTTLIDKKQQFNTDCVKCHSTYYQQDNGFYDIRTTPNMANVQCETCHGPGLQHMQDMRLLSYAKDLEESRRTQIEARVKTSMPKRHPDAALCLTCHTPDNDDHFVYEEKLPKVAHSKGPAVPVSVPAPAAGAPTARVIPAPNNSAPAR